MRIRNFKKFVVVGCGGTGSILIPQLVRYLYSQQFAGQVIFVDGDSYEDSNRNRQSFLPKFIGKNKAEFQAIFVGNFFPELKDKISFIPKFMGAADVEEILEPGTAVINCADNSAIRKLIQDRGQTLTDFIHICCGNEMTTGQVQMYAKLDNQELTPSIYVDSPGFDSADGDRSKMNCQELSGLPSGGQVISSNMFAATLALCKVIFLFSNTFFKTKNVPNRTSKFCCMTPAVRTVAKDEK